MKKYMSTIAIHKREGRSTQTHHARIYLFGLGLILSAAAIVDVVIILVYWSAAQ